MQGGLSFLAKAFFILVFGCPLLAQEILKNEPAEHPVKIEKENKKIDESWRLKRGEKEFGVELSFSPMQPTFLSGRKEYDPSGRTFGMMNFRWGRNIGTAKGVSVEYRIEIVPVALAFKNEVENPDARTTSKDSKTIRKTTYGFGFTPVGFRFYFRPDKRLKPFLSADAGFIFFNKPVPIPRSMTYDFIGSFGGGLMYHVDRRKAVSVGYRYFHISNINIGEINPGYNANILYVGYSFFYK